MDAEETMDLCAFDKLFKVNVPHILEKIFFYLDLDSFLNCSKVNKDWKQLLASEAFRKKGKTVYHKAISKKVWFAARDGYDENVRTLLSTGMVDVNYRWYAFLATPLHIAVRRGQTKVVHLLLEEGADPDIADGRLEFGITPLMSAAKYGFNDIIKILLNKGADSNKADEYGMAWTDMRSVGRRSGCPTAYPREARCVD